MYVCQRIGLGKLVRDKLSRIETMENVGALFRALQIGALQLGALQIDPPGFPAYTHDMSESGTIDQATQDIVDEFSFFDDWMQRYEYIIELGKKLEGLPDAKKDDAHLVPGCQSRVWFHARFEDGHVRFEADSDAVIVRGLIALLLRVYSDRTPEEIVSTPPEFFEVLELGSHLSGSRANGLRAMVDRIHAYARAYRDGGAKAAEAAPGALG